MKTQRLSHEELLALRALDRLCNYWSKEGGIQYMDNYRLGLESEYVKKLIKKALSELKLKLCKNMELGLIDKA